MDQITHDVRRANWLSIITECQQRPMNVTTKQWLPCFWHLIHLSIQKMRIPLERNSQSAIAVRLSAPNGKFLH